jgi:glycosyltransferase involved in cell wall biosynthesis
MDEPTFSILMPAYNAEATIDAAVRSVLRQTRSDFELIVVDDGSADGTAERVRQHGSDARVRLIRQPNAGQAQARNAALAIARGRFVCLLDSDDVWLPRYLEAMGETLDRHPEAAVAYTDAWVFHQEIGRIARRSVLQPVHPPTAPDGPEAFLRALLERGNFMFVGVTMRAAVFTDVGPFRLGVDGSEDYELWLRLAAHGYRFVRAPEMLAIYRRRPGQMTSRAEHMRAVADEVLRIVEEEYDVPEDVRELAGRRIPVSRVRPPGRPRAMPQLVAPAYRALARLRWFYLRPPRPVREAYPDLRAL